MDPRLAADHLDRLNCWAKPEAHAIGAGRLKRGLYRFRLYSGLLDAAQDLGIGSWSLTRKRLPAPPVAPSADADVQAYLSGYFLGHALLTLAWQRSSSGKPYRTPQPSATITAYTSAIATPVAQRLLAAPGEQSVMSAHQFACLLAREIGRPILDVETEVGLYRWLAGRSGIAAPAYLDELLGRLRQKREDRPA